MSCELKKCSKCRKTCSVSHFIGVNGKTTKTCVGCRAIKKIKDQSNRDVQISHDFEPNKRKIALVERVDKSKLNYIIANHERFDLGSAYVDGRKLDRDGQLTLLVHYHNSLNLSGEMDVSYHQKAYGFGRYYGHRKLQLQNLSKTIRHTIAQERMVDVDIKNAHPTLLQWYCRKNDIPCEGLSYYIDNRDLCLEEISTLKGLDKDDVKQDLLAIINGRDKYEGQVDGYPDWFTEFYFNVKDITDRVCELEPKFKRAATQKKQGDSKRAGYNIGGTTINYLMTDLENRALMAIYDLCQAENIKVASLVYDGIMLYKEGLPKDLAGLLQRMQDRVAVVLDGCRVEIVQKQMDHGYDIDYEVMEYRMECLNHLVTHDEQLSVLFDKYSTPYVRKVDIPADVRYVRDLEWDDHRRVLCLNSCMGSGKTTSVCRWIRENNPKRVAVLSPRISFAKSITHEYNAGIGEDQVRFRCYKDMSASEISTCDRIVISMESLHKLSFDYCMAHPFDLVVVDECQANLTSHTCKETNGRHFNVNAEAFNGMLRSSPRILFCDAFINGKTIEFLTHFQLPTLLLNYKRRMDKRKATILESVDANDYDALFPLIAADLQADKRVYVCATSAKRASEWAITLERKFPDKQIRLYAKGSGKEINDVRKEWDVDCVITTTTITVGINYDVPGHFHKCYMSFSSRARNNVVDLFQCHYRVRHLIDNEVVIHLMDEPERGCPCSETGILKDLQWFERHKQELFQLFESAPLYLKKLLCYNQLESNLSVSRMSHLVHAFLVECDYDVETKKTRQEDIACVDMIPQEIPPFYDIPLVDQNEYRDLRSRMNRGAALSDMEKSIVQKYKFVEFFTEGMPGDWIDNHYDEEFWYIFNEYRQAKLNNLKTEKRVKRGARHFEALFRREHDKNSLAVMSSRGSGRVHKLIEILRDLGLDHSQKIGDQIPKTRIDQWCRTVRADEANIRSIFNLQDRRKGKEELTDKQAVTLLNSILKDHGYTQLKQVSCVKKVDGKNQRDPDAPYVIEDFKAHLKSNGLSPCIGERIYNSFVLDSKDPVDLGGRDPKVDVATFEGCPLNQ